MALDGTDALQRADRLATIRAAKSGEGIGDPARRSANEDGSPKGLHQPAPRQLCRLPPEPYRFRKRNWW